MKRFSTSGQAAFAALVLCLLGSACCAGSYVTVTPLQGYYSGGSVYYLMTDVSDPVYATTFNVNYTPLLANALYNPYIQYAYYVTNYPQGLVFSTQWPKAYSAAGNYMPVWVLSTVTWRSGAPTVLRSVAQISAKAANVIVRRTRIVVGASILINSLGASIPQAKVWRNGTVLVSLPSFGVFVDDVAYAMLRLDFSNLSEAMLYKGNWSPMLGKFDIARATALPAAWQNIYALWTSPPAGQLPVARQVPSPFGPGNTNADYTPVMVEWSVRSPGGVLPPYTSYAAIQAALLPTSPTSYWAYQPIIASLAPPP